MNSIVSNNKIELRYNSDKMEYTLVMYDIYGHYIDETTLSREDVKELYEGLDAVKGDFIR